MSNCEDVIRKYLLAFSYELTGGLNRPGMNRMISVRKVPTKLDYSFKGFVFTNKALDFTDLSRSGSSWTSVKCCKVPLGGVTI